MIIGGWSKVSGRCQAAVEQSIPPGAGERQAIRMEGAPDAGFREVREVEGVMAPPGAVVVPEVVVGIGGIDPRDELGLVHVAFFLPTQQEGGKTKAARHIRTAAFPRRDFCSGSLDPAHRAAKRLSLKAPLAFSEPGCQVRCSSNRS